MISNAAIAGNSHRPRLNRSHRQRLLFHLTVVKLDPQCRSGAHQTRHWGREARQPGSDHCGLWGPRDPRAPTRDLGPGQETEWQPREAGQVTELRLGQVLLRPWLHNSRSGDSKSDESKVYSSYRSFMKRLHESRWKIKETPWLLITLGTVCAPGIAENTDTSSLSLYSWPLWFSSLSMSPLGD